jgi:N-carbamoylputrescine amidase
MPQNKGAEVILRNYIAVIIFCQDVDNFALAEPLYSTSFTFFECFSKELGVVIIVPFEKEIFRIYHNSTYISIRML